jgi:hypothetical protein
MVPLWRERNSGSRELFDALVSKGQQLAEPDLKLAPKRSLHPRFQVHFLRGVCCRRKVAWFRRFQQALRCANGECFKLTRCAFTSRSDNRQN